MDKLILRKYIILYLLILIGIFIQFTFLGAVGNIIIKILIISAVSYYLYDSWLREGNKDTVSPDSTEDIEIMLPEDTAQADKTVFEKDIADIELPGGINKNRFDFLQRQFKLFVKVLSPQNAYLCYKTITNEVFLLKSELVEGFKETEDIIPAELITLIDQKNGILIENKLESDSSLLPFYNDKEYTAESVLGIKTELGKAGNLYWICDAETKDYFKREDVPYLEALSENTFQFLSAENQAEKLSLENSIIADNFNLTMQLYEADSVTEKIEQFVNALIENFEASKLTVCLLKDMNSTAETAIIQKTVGLKDGFDDGYEFPVNEGLNGWVVMKNKAYLIDNIEKGDYFIPRFSRDEKSNFGLCSYLAVPIPHKTRAVGLIALEHLETNKYKNDDKEKLIAYCNIFAKAIEKDVITESGG
jgi:hypothetical protein